jgi:3,4-dihydroxy 2-butanone 4-phosphate synthase/GTP cyclohydrolase II
MIGEEGKGLVLFMRHSEKKDSVLRTLQMLDKKNANGLDLKNAPLQGTDQKDFGVGAQILRDMGISKLRLLSRNVKRRVALSGYGLEIVERVQL